MARQLPGNRIRKLERGSFWGLKKLKYLRLNNNAIESIEPGAFENLKELKWLLLGSNQLETFDLSLLRDTPSLRLLDLSRNKIAFLPGATFEYLANLIWLQLEYNQIQTIQHNFVAKLPSLQLLDLSYNIIDNIEEEAFYNNLNLTELSLSYNRLPYLKPKLFYNLINLQKLNLSFNPLNNLPVEIFLNVGSLNSLQLEGFEILNIGTEHFETLKELEFIHFTKFRYCSYAPYVRNCYPKTDGLSSVEHLLGWPVLRLSVWVVALMTCTSNTVVLTWRVLSRKEDRVLSLFVKNLSVADFLMGIYLLSIGAQDVIYRDTYNQHARSWMSSWRCTLCGMLAMVSCEVSVLILSLITFERYHCIRTNVRVVTERAAKFSLLGVWMTGALLALLPVFQLFDGHSFYATNGLCFPLHIHDPFMMGWQYSAFVFLGVNFFAVLLIIILYLWMFLTIKQDRRRARPVLLKQKEDLILAWRFFFIVLTDCLCWIPIIVIKIVALSQIPINDNLYAFVVVFILPVNSALNPVIYTLAAPTELRRRIHNIVRGTWICKSRHSFASTDSKTPNSSLATQSSCISDGRSSSNGTVVIPAMSCMPVTIAECSNEESDTGDETRL